MTSSELKAKILEADPDTHFFDHKTMKFFGDRMSNYGVRETKIRYSGEVVEVYELYRRKAVKHGLRSSAYFDKNTFKRIHAALD